jgi:hypothetical protein
MIPFYATPARTMASGARRILTKDLQHLDSDPGMSSLPRGRRMNMSNRTDQALGIAPRALALASPPSLNTKAGTAG